jgi:hypothetical protein
MMREGDKRVRKPTRRTVLKAGTAGLLVSTGLPVATAKSSTDGIDALNEKFSSAIESHGKPQIIGERRRVDGEVMYDTGGPTVSASKIPNGGDVVLASVFGFEDGTQQNQVYSQLENDTYSVEYLGSTYHLKIDEDDRRHIRQRLSKLDRELSAEIEKARKDRFPKKRQTRRKNNG